VDCGVPDQKLNFRPNLYRRGDGEWRKSGRQVNRPPGAAKLAVFARLEDLGAELEVPRARLAELRY
jgi:hypothetical protein